MPGFSNSTWRFTTFIGQYNDPISNKLNFYDLKFVNKTIRNSNSACRWQGNYSEFNMPELEEVYALEHFVHALNINYPKSKKKLVNLW